MGDGGFEPTDLWERPLPIPQPPQLHATLVQAPRRIEGELRIHNVLALAVLESEQKIELDKVVGFFVNAIYNPDQFPALRIEVRGPLTGSTYTVSLFEGGRIQSAGGCMPREAGLCMKRVARRLQTCLNMKIRFRNFEVHNLLGVVDLNCSISIGKLFSLAPGQKDYEPDKFPALRISLPVPTDTKATAATASNAAAGEIDKKSKRALARLTPEKKKRKAEAVTASIFSNGKINLVGGKSVRSIIAVIEELRPFIEACT